MSATDATCFNVATSLDPLVAGGIEMLMSRGFRLRCDYCRALATTLT
jgi:hypothetical protein